MTQLAMVETGSLCYAGRLSLYCFLGCSALVFTVCAQQVFFDFTPDAVGSLFWGSVFYYIILNVLIRFLLKGFFYQIGLRATFLGFVFSTGILTVIYAPRCWKPLGIYATTMSSFHYGEFLGIAWSNPLSLNVDSFILNHSVHYALAAVSSWVEFLIELYFVPSLKEYYIFWILGVLVCLVAEFLRKAAMITAGSNFNHLVQFEKTEDHQLITHGVYGYMRHPSYVGFFWWSIGTQIILFNPICIVLYAIVSWKFFHDRIFIEEITLLNFFGSKYYDYQQKVPTGIPFIKGYEIEQ